MNKNTHALVQLVWLLSVSVLFVKPATATPGPCAPQSWSYTTTAVLISPDVSGRNASSTTPGGAGGNGGRIIVKTGVPVDTGNGSDGPLTGNVTLYSGTYNYTYIASAVTIFIDGDVTIKCPHDFRAHVRGVFHPDQPPPCVRIYVGHPEVFYHSFSADMTERSYQMFNSDGSGMDGGSLEFYTSEPGDLWSSSQAKGGYGGDSGRGGNGGEITLVANGGIVVGSSTADGANGGWGPDYSSPGFGNGGAGGDGGKIFISGLGFASSVGTASLSVNGGAGGSAQGGSYPCGSRGGRGGSAGAIVIAAPLCPTNTYTTSATGGNGGYGGEGADNWGNFGAVKDGFPGGDGGSGGAPGVLIGITGFATPGNGGNGGNGGWVFTGNVPPIGIGGAGGNGGNSGGTGAVPGIGGPGGGNSYSPNGDAPRGEDGIVENLPPPRPPSATASHLTYILCVGTRDHDETPSAILATNNFPYLDGDRGADYVCNAFKSLPNIPLKPISLPLDTSQPDNGASLYREIIRAANTLSPGDNFIFYINCHGLIPATLNGDVALGLSRVSDPFYPKWGYDVTDDVFTRWFSNGVWPNVHKLFIMDCCHALRFWNRPSDDDDLASLNDVGILAACDRDTTAVANGDDHPLVACGVLGQALVRALNNLSTRNAITFAELVQTTKDMGATMALTGGVFNGIIQDESTNFSINATCVWAPMWTNTSDFVMNLILVTNWLHLSFSSAHPLTSNGLDLSLDASPGLNCRMEVSTNLVSWTTLTNFVTTNSTMYFRDSSATNFNRRFYRAVVP